MGELGIIAQLATQLKDNSLLLIILGAYFALKIIDAFKNKNSKWQKFVTGKIYEIEHKIVDIINTIALHDNLINKTSEGTLENKLFIKIFDPFLRLKSFRRLLAMGKNGRVWKEGFNLILQNKEVWLNVLDTELGIEITHPDYYNAKLDEINRRIYDGFMK
jgi:hypothetical protein